MNCIDYNRYLIGLYTIVICWTLESTYIHVCVSCMLFRQYYNHEGRQVSCIDSNDIIIIIMSTYHCQPLCYCVQYKYHSSSNNTLFYYKSPWQQQDIFHKPQHGKWIQENVGVTKQTIINATTTKVIHGY